MTLIDRTAQLSYIIFCLMLALPVIAAVIFCLVAGVLGCLALI